MILHLIRHVVKQMADYITEAEGTTYMGERLNASPWDSATSVDRVKAIKMGTKIIDQLNYLGEKTSSTQENQFPRNDDVDVPQNIKDACAEIALALLDGVDTQIEFENLSMTQHSFVNTKIVFDRDIKPEHTLSGVPSIIAWRLLSPYLRDPRTVSIDRVS